MIWQGSCGFHPKEKCGWEMEEEQERQEGVSAVFSLSLVVILGAREEEKLKDSPVCWVLIYVKVLYIVGPQVNPLVDRASSRKERTK